MTDRGRHSRRSGVGFYKDVLFLVAGILIVGALVFGGLSLWAGRSGDSTTTTTVDVSSSTTTVPAPTSPPSTAPVTTTTSPPATAPDSTAPPTTLRPVREPSEVRVVVLNSTQTVGVAGRLSDSLAELGYQMAEPTNYTPELSDSMIFHAEGFSLEAVELAEAVGDGTVAANQELADDQGVDIVVVIGLSYQE